MTENTVKIIKYLKENKANKVTAADVAADLGIAKKSVDGTFTMAIQGKGYGHRIPAQIPGDDGVMRDVKYLVLDQSGLDLDI